MTPLYLAAFRGHTDTVQVLLAWGVEPNTPVEQGWTPLHTAAWKGHTGVVDLLLNHGM